MTSHRGRRRSVVVSWSAPAITIQRFTRGRRRDSAHPDARPDRENDSRGRDVSSERTGASAPRSNTRAGQPKFDGRVDQEIDNGQRHVTYAGVAAGRTARSTQVADPSISRVAPNVFRAHRTTRAAGEIRVFTNHVDAEAPNLLVPDRATAPARVEFQDADYNVEVGRSSCSEVGNRSPTAAITGVTSSTSPSRRRRGSQRDWAGTSRTKSSANRFRFRSWSGSQVRQHGDRRFSPRLTAMFGADAQSFRGGI